MVNQKLDTVESLEEVQERIEQAVNLFGEERVLLTPDCGFATFADNPVASARTAEAKLRAIVEARDLGAGLVYHPLERPLEPRSHVRQLLN